MDRYHEAIGKSRVVSDDAAVAAEVANIVEKAPQYAGPEVYKFLLNSIDLTTLSSEDSDRSVARFTNRVNDFDAEYPQYGHVAAICVYSNFAEVVKDHLDVDGVDVCVVAGCFPSSQTFTAVKVADVALAVEAGARPHVAPHGGSHKLPPPYYLQIYFLPYPSICYNITHIETDSSNTRTGICKKV